VAQTTDEIRVKFVTEGGELVSETFRKTSEAADQFHQKVSKAGGALGDLRLKSEGRIAANVGAVAQSLTSGAGAAEVFATAITRATESFRGSVLFASASVVGLSIYEGVTRAGEAVIALNNDIANLHRASLIPGDFLGTDRINKNLDTALGRIGELEHRLGEIKVFGDISRSFGNLLGPGGSLVGGVFTKLFTGLEQSRLKEVQEEGARTLDQLADKQRTLNEATIAGLSGDEKKAQLLKVQADHLERAFKISELEAKLGISGTEAQSTETSRFNLENSAIEKKSRLQEKSLDLQRRILDVEKDLLLPSEQNLRVLDLKVRYYQNILDKEHFLTDQEREQTKLQLGQAQLSQESAQRTFFRTTNAGQFAFAKQMEEQEKKVFDEQKAEFLKHEQLRRSGLERDVRGPYLREYEDLVFGHGATAMQRRPENTTNRTDELVGMKEDVAAIRRSIEAFSVKIAVV